MYHAPPIFGTHGGGRYFPDDLSLAAPIVGADGISLGAVKFPFRLAYGSLTTHSQQSSRNLRERRMRYPQRSVPQARLCNLSTSTELRVGLPNRLGHRRAPLRERTRLVSICWFSSPSVGIRAYVQFAEPQCIRSRSSANGAGTRAPYLPLARVGLQYVSNSENPRPGQSIVYVCSKNRSTPAPKSRHTDALNRYFL